MNAIDTAVVLSEKFLHHRCADSHPEHAGRIEPLFPLFASTFQGRVSLIDPVTAKDKDLLLVHAEEMVNSLRAQRGASGWIDPDTYYGPQSSEVAWLAAGGTIDLTLRIWKGEYRRGFSLVRPPGHHATPTRSMGFCLLNNIALAAAAVLQEKKDARIAIVDFDLHHGNGTQDAFYENPNVLFISSHRYPFYPGSGALKENGSGTGKGTTVNFPLDRPFGDPLFLPLYEGIVRGLLEQFRPEMIFVSAGFDGHFADPMQGFQLSTEAYGRLSDILVAAAESTTGKILFCLEGGYEPTALANSIEMVTERLISLPRKPFSTEIPDLGGDLSVVDRFRNYYSPFFPGI